MERVHLKTGTTRERGETEPTDRRGQFSTTNPGSERQSRDPATITWGHFGAGERKGRELVLAGNPVANIQAHFVGWRMTTDLLLNDATFFGVKEVSGCPRCFWKYQKARPRRVPLQAGSHPSTLTHYLFRPPGKIKENDILISFLTITTNH
ncbi:hypothetical protein DAPPUDRAFT_112318 [Daphnia pulex]|uniref:Uncharacterized protein n=1 Tax=Daphnia pulex TaxID=6669 RepID=E9HBN4_DAPPU|nr:hypothetical protein DAPPUDRAFT_112318 [Daphnia pulex]|eukprot:EFX70888.1 hypothetical protein DAPPUDRAFT_112318 [Daphnia pulex]